MIEEGRRDVVVGEWVGFDMLLWWWLDCIDITLLTTHSNLKTFRRYLSMQKSVSCLP